MLIERLEQESLCVTLASLLTVFFHGLKPLNLKVPCNYKGAQNAITVKPSTIKTA